MSPAQREITERRNLTTADKYREWAKHERDPDRKAQYLANAARFDRQAAYWAQRSQ